MSHNLELAFACLNAWSISCYVRVQVHQISVSVQHLNLYLSHSLNHQIQLKFLNQLKFPGIFSEVPDLLRKFRTSLEVPDFELFHEIFSYPFIFISSKTTPFIIQNSLPVSLSLKTLSLSLTSFSLSPNPPPPQISGSSSNLRKFGSKCLQVDHLCLHCIPLGHLLKESRYCLMLPYWNFFPISLIRSN